MTLKLKRNDKIGCFFFVAFILSSSLLWLFEDRFDAERWRHAEGVRHEMVDDLIESQVLDDMAKAEVINLLGEPDETLSEGNHFIYDLGVPKSFFEPKREFLLVTFSNQKVDEVTLAVE